MYYVSDIIGQIPSEIIIRSLINHFNLDACPCELDACVLYMSDFVRHVYGTEGKANNDVVALCYEYDGKDRSFYDVRAYYKKDIYECVIPTVVSDGDTDIHSVIKIRNLMPAEIIKDQLTIADFLGFSIDLQQSEKIGISYIESMFIYMHDLYSSDNPVNRYIKENAPVDEDHPWVITDDEVKSDSIPDKIYDGINAELAALLEYKIKYSTPKSLEKLREFTSNTDMQQMQNNYVFFTNSSCIESFFKYFELRYDLNEMWVIPVASSLMSLLSNADYDRQCSVLDVILKCREENTNLLYALNQYIFS